MIILKISSGYKIKGLILDTESGLVFNPNSKTIKLVSSNLKLKKHYNGDEYVYFTSKRRGFNGDYRVLMDNLINAEEEEIMKFKKFLFEIKTCECCNKKTDSVNDEGICKECVELNCKKCNICGTWKMGRDLYEVDGMTENICLSCISPLDLQQCNKCGIFYDRNKITGFHYNKICIDCNEKKYDHSILRYHGNPTVNFKNGKTDSNLYFGFELEIDKAGKDNINSNKIGSIVGDDVFFTTDCSLNRGFEIVSQPMHFDYFMNRKNLYGKMFSKAMDLGYRSQQTTTCGLHFHMSKKHFTECEIVKLVYLFEKHWDYIEKFSRRSKGKLDRWTSRYGNNEVYNIENNDIAKDNEKAKNKIGRFENMGRYKAINLTNRETIEVRIFRGTLDINTFTSSMQFLNHIVKMVKTVEFDELRNMSWTQLIKNDYVELNEYLLLRGISTNTIGKAKRAVDKK